MGSVANILVGVGSIRISAPLDPATFLPDDAVTTATSWRDVGYTIDGLEVTLEPNMVDINVDQLGDAAKLIEENVKVMLKTTLAEATLTNLAVAWGMDDTATATTQGLASSGLDSGVAEQLNIGVFSTGIPLERSIYFEGKGPGGVKRTYEGWRCISVSASGHSYKRGEATVYPVEFRLLANPAHTGNEYGRIRDFTTA
jgi:hypothetical protein